jgi:hypothetical protein
METQTSNQTKLAALLAAEVLTNPDLVPFYLGSMEMGLNRLLSSLSGIDSPVATRRANTIRGVAYALGRLKYKITGE